LLTLILAFGYLFFTLSLNRASDGTFERLAKLPPRDMPSVLVKIPEPPQQPSPVVVAETPPTPPPPQVKPPSRLDNLLAF
ncbi:type VI secretion system protein TssL, partial [Rhizobium ruizarguesonis]